VPWHILERATSSLYAAVYILAERFYILGKSTFLNIQKESTKKYTRGGAPLHELLFNLKFSLFIFWQIWISDFCSQYL